MIVNDKLIKIIFEEFSFYKIKLKIRLILVKLFANANFVKIYYKQLSSINNWAKFGDYIENNLSKSIFVEKS
jgi:hypothetical protein